MRTEDQPRTNSAVFGDGARLVRSRQARGKSVKGAFGVDLMRKINDGFTQLAPSAEIEEIRYQITKNCEEIIEQGARIRPLIADRKQIGWVRGLHVTERQLLTRWVFDPNEFLASVLKVCTSLTKEEVDHLTSNEVRRMAELIVKMSDYDLSLFPYLSAFSTTSISENLWYSKGTTLTAYENRVIRFPDGRFMTIMCPPEHAKLWSTLCNYREASKKRLDDNFNALLIVQPWAGKSADPLRAELRAAQRSMQANSSEPWNRIIRVQQVSKVEDGWAHSMDDDSREGLLHEMHGMFANDKHEQFMEKFYKQQEEKAIAEKKRFDEMLTRRGGSGVTSEVVGIVTEAESRQRERELKKGRSVPAPVKREEATPTPQEKIHRYRS